MKNRAILIQPAIGWLLVAGLLTASVPVRADMKHENRTYGQINMSLQREESNPSILVGSLASERTTIWKVVSNNSRLGIRGKFSDAQSPISLLYQLEYQVYPDDGDPQITQRNSYLAVRGNFGKVGIGFHDTPVKRSQLKVDLFNDSIFDLKNLLPGEERLANMLWYESPALANGSVQLVAAGIFGEHDNADLNDDVSASVAYSKGNIRLALAVDSRIGTNHSRLAVQWKLDDLQLGLLLQDTDPAGDEASPGTASLLSVKYRWGDNGANNAVYGQIVDSNQLAVNVTFSGLGYEYKFHKKARWYAFYGVQDGGKADRELSTLATGLEFKF